MGRNDIDEYNNLILLCKVHHKKVDDQPETYPIEKLREMKAAHERWVKERLSNKSTQGQPQFIQLYQIKTGKDIANIIGDAHVFSFDHDEQNTEEEVELVAGFLQNLQDWGETWSEMDSGQHVKARFMLTDEIKGIEAAGLLVFGLREVRKMKLKTNNTAFDWEVATIAVVHPTNPGIIKLGGQIFLIAATPGPGIV
ncbi:transposase [Fimbriiglobus ruber]|uniref:Transposase n=1 Tax=Fimbriiglobus ruber TaxID=1908690 RepID=A0A225E2Y8_9BACT|nr:transposase [Fimbriiglobus ruber]